MPSNAYIHYVCVRIRDVVCKHMKEKFMLTEELADLYLGLLQCPVCSVHMRSVWRTQLNTLFIGAFENMFCACELSDIMQFDARIPHELKRDRWMPMVIQKFDN